jgi:peptidoglycan hydrolase-like protein with peptidoglycan-binding domain
MKKGLLFIGLFASLVLVFSSLASAALYRTLRQGSTGADVKELQVLLNKDPETRIAVSGAGSPGRETSSFGALTRQAVVKFQSKYADEVLYSVGLSFPTGVVGPQTRNKLNQLFGSNPSNVPSTPTQNIPAPYISSISPDTVTTSPQMLTISGTGFSSMGNSIVVISDSDKVVGSYSSSDGKTVTFPFTSNLAEKIKIQLAPYKNTSEYQNVLSAFVTNLTGENISTEGGVTYVRAILLVKNSGGQSNTVAIKINIKSLLQ